MKFLLFMLSGLFCAPAIFATVHTVSNDPNKPAQFNSISTAFAAAAPGDTLYVYGSPNTYSAVAVNKSITIIGPGYAARKEDFFKAQITNVILTGGVVSNITFDGITATDLTIDGNSFFNLTNITIRNCLFGNLAYPGGNIACGSQLNNWLIENSVFAASFGLGNIFNCGATGITAPIVNGVLIRNCVLRGGLSSNNNLNIVNCQIGFANSLTSFGFNRNCSLTNCIFMNGSFAQNNSNLNNTFQNCLTYLTVTPSPTFDLNSWTGGASGSATNCIINQNPLWQQPATDNELFNFNTRPGRREVWNPALLASSPARNAGTDGTDIGASGGSQPYRPDAEARIPVVRRYQLTNPVVPANGTINIRATATRPQ